MTTLTARIANVAILALGMIPAAALSTAAHAQTVVRVGDLNLASASGRAVYEQRLDTAARQFCSRETTLNIQAACRAGVRDEVNAKLSGGVRLASRT